jgi:hypothetical protein
MRWGTPSHAPRDPVRNVMGVTDPAGSVTSRDHDAALRLVREVGARSGGAFLARTTPQATGTPSANSPTCASRRTSAATRAKPA